MRRTDWNHRKWVLSAIQYAIGLVALVWFLSHLSLTSVVELLDSLSVPTVIALVLVTGGGQVCLYLLWRLLFSQFQRTPLTDAARVSLAVDFVNVTVPSRAPALVLNPLVIRHHTDLDATASVAVTFVHTLLFAILYALVATVGVVAVATHVSAGVLLVLGVGIGVYISVGVIGLVSVVQLTTLWQLLARVRQRVPLASRLPDSLGWNQAMTAEIRTHAETLLSRWPLVALYTIVWFGGIVLPSGIRIGILLAATGYGFTPLWVLPAVVIAAYSVTVLPVSVGGIGVAEATASLLFVSLGYPLEIVAPIVLLDRLLAEYVPGVIGFLPATGVDFHER